MNAYFQELGRAVRARWLAEDFSLAAFPAIARAALEENPPAARVEVGAFIREFLLDDEQPFQTSSPFGQPEIVAFDDPRFYIQVLFWLDGTTQIHQHEFSGAFHVLAGSSLHAEYAFENVRPVTAHFRLGDLRLVSTELLETGRTVPITSGGGCVHSLFHLETPSLTVVVRTHSDPGTGPQFTYLPPHVAVDPFFSDALTTRRNQLLDVLERTENPEYAVMTREMIAGLDFERGFFALQNCATALRALGEWEETWAVFAEKHGARAALIAPTLEEAARRDTLVGLRGSVADPDHRFFLALLLNVPDRAGVLDLVARRFPENPVETILLWATELSDCPDERVWMLDAGFPEEIEADPDDQLNLLSTVLRRHLAPDAELAPGEADLAPEDVEVVRAALLGSGLRVLVA